MVVMKFGGTSVGSPSRMNEVLDIVERQSGQRIVVLSAMSGTTNDLVSIGQKVKKGAIAVAQDEVNQMHDRYMNVIAELNLSDDYIGEARKIVSTIFDYISSLVTETYSINNERVILAQGELLSTNLVHLLAASRGIKTKLINALDFMRINEKQEPNLSAIESLIQPIIKESNASIAITQGYICKNHHGQIDNLKRGGSDYSATIIGSILKAEEIQIWTDIDGVHNNDPRIVEDTQAIRNLSYREAAELAYFGAKILHPTCVLPAENASIDIRLKYTMEPEASGTLISNQTSEKAITAIAAKDGITAINIYSHRMLNAYGFLRKVFQIFEDHKTSVDMITTSEVAVSLTIDDDSNLAKITRELKALGEVKTQNEYSIICIVGNALYDNQAKLQHIFDALEDLPIRMVSMGGSRYNISLLIKSQNKVKALQRLNRLFHLVEA